MSKSKTTSDTQKEYRYIHPKYKTSTNRTWLKDRLKYPTGFCTSYIPLDAQGHEGTKPVTRDGHPRKICTFWETCPCTCHEEIDQMYELTGLPREPAEQSPEYAARVAQMQHETQVMLDSLAIRTRDYDVLSSSDGGILPPDTERPANGHTIDPTDMLGSPAKPTFAPTPTGRRARGQLEYDVLSVCMDFANSVFDWPLCTPKMVSEEIGKRNASECPSTGAINAVWDRWEKLDFAVQAKKPSNFVRFIPEDVSATVLDMIKSRTRREKRRGVAESRRGELRPKARRGK